MTHNTQEMLACAAQGSDGLIGLVAMSTAAQGDGALLGCCTGQIETEEGSELALLTLVVDSGAQRQGLGAMLVHGLIDECRCVCEC